MATSFPFLRLPAEIQIEIFKHYFKAPFDLGLSVIEEQSVFFPPKLFPAENFQHDGAGKKEHLCVLWTSPDLREQAQKALFDSFSGRLVCSFDEHGMLPVKKSTFEKKLLPCLPVGRLKSVTFDDEKEFSYGPMRMPMNTSWKAFASVFEGNGLSSLMTITVKYRGSHTKGVKKDNLENFLDGKKDAACRDCIGPRLRTLGLPEPSRIRNSVGETVGLCLVAQQPWEVIGLQDLVSLLLPRVLVKRTAQKRSY